MHGFFSILLHLPRYLRLTWRLMKDSQVPLLPKILVVGAVIYVLSPYDLIPEGLIPEFGLGDDLGVLILSIWYLIRCSPPDVVTRHAREIAQESEKKKSRQRK